MTLDEFKTHCLPMLIAAFADELDVNSFNFIEKSPNYFVAELNDVPQFVQKTLFKNIFLTAKFLHGNTYDYIHLAWAYDHPTGGGSNGYSFGYMINKENEWELIFS